MHKSKSSLATPIKEQEGKQKLSFTTKIMVPLVSFVRSPLQSLTTKPLRSRTTTLRNLLVLITLFAIISLTIDGLLVSLISQQHTRKNIPEAATYPTMIPVPNTIYPGQISFLHLAHFTPNTQVFLSRDIAQSVRIDTPLPVIRVDANGNANVRIYIEDSWNVGMHYIQAEDISDHFTASTVLRVIGTWLVPPPHLVVQSLTTPHAITSINMGSAPLETNTLQSLLLHNAGGSVLSWTAHSDQSWLQFTPTSGVFSNSERIYLAVSRAHLKAGKYTATITIQSNAGEPLHFFVQMQIQPVRSSTGPHLVVSPLVQSLTAIDGNSTPLEQTFSITNGGSHTLAWSLNNIAPAALLDQNMLFLANTHWLDATPAKGTLAPGATTTVHIVVHSQRLLPSVYGNRLQFASGSYTQPVALSLTVLPRCGLDINQAALTFTIHTHDTQPSQDLTAHRTTNCAEHMRWGSYTPDNWLTTNSAHGTITDTHMLTIAVFLKSSTLPAGTYAGFIMLFTQHRSQTVMVTLNLLASTSTIPTATIANGTDVPHVPPHATAGTDTKSQQKNNQPGRIASQNIEPSFSLALSTSSIAFTLTQGQQSSSTQAVSIENTGGDAFAWSASTIQNSPWISLASTAGTLNTGQTNPLSITVAASNLAIGTYTATTTITATDDDALPASSSSQTITITVTIVQPCTFSASPNAITFTSTLLQPRSSQQTIAIASSGYCPYPLTWTAHTDDNNPWLTLSSTSGNDNGSGSTITANINANGILLGVYKTQIEVTEVDKNGAALQNNPQTITVTLTVVA